MNELLGARDKAIADWWDQNMKLAWDNVVASTNHFDQAMLAVSSAALGLSVSFLRGQQHTPAHIRWLFTSWVCFTVCIGLTILTFLIGITANQSRVKYLDDVVEYLKKNVDASKLPKDRKGPIFNRVQTTLLWSNFVLLTFGIVATIRFCWLNAI